ncbi:S-layer homology domain-containing protein [Aminipila terrae]|uniref:SLH domain-containing protein n=1 Tax=Aminipila terrae TaxID=2697030 RepID=A0A6P1MF66_9FIRM|nr:S-layer homology domain-containing protein [Aminipila terrae]QHI71783.1 hypothetical protein Ami3637_04725 [Aminipila terrae]
MKRLISLIAIITMLVTITTVSPVSSYAITSTSYAFDVLSTGLNQAINVIKGPDNKLYISEYGGGSIVRVDRDGQNKTNSVTALNQPIGMAFDGSGNLYIAEHAGSQIDKVSAGGAKTVIKTETGLLTGLVIDSGNNLYAVQYSSGTILKMNLNGSGSTDFVTGLGSNSIIGMTIDSANNLYVADRSGGKIKKITPSGTVTDFITGLSTPTWVTLGEDGYFYVSLGSRSIEKYDVDGNKVAAFATPSTIGYPWGSYVDQAGSIYFLSLGSVCKKIIGTAGTTDKTHIELVLNTTLSDGIVDTAAFNVSGVASNPQITEAIVSGSSIRLTLNDNMSYTDNIKVSYAKTGTNNLVVSGKSIELDDFTNMPVTNNILKVTSVANLSDINVSNGTNLSTITGQLPASVTLTLSNSTTTNSAVTWDGGTPTYDGNTGGTYVFSGTVAISENLSNPSNLKARVNVIVAPASSGSSGKSSHSTTSPTASTNDNTIVKVNGEEQRIGTENKSNENGVSKVQVSVNSDTMGKMIDAEMKANSSKETGKTNVAEVNVMDKSANIAIVGLTGEIVKKLDQNNFDVLIKKGEVAYNIPAKELTVDDIAKKLSVTQEGLKEIKFEIQMKQMSKEQETTYGEKVKANNGEILIAPVDFSVVAKVTRADGSSQDVTIKSFKQYVQRIFEVPSDVNPNEITTGIVFNEDGSYSHVPTTVFKKDGKWYAGINSLTNSTYSVIHSPITVESVKGHWSKETVDDMASRLVLTDYKNFDANKAVTRTEFADYIVRALGLYREDEKSKSIFSDITVNNKNNVSIQKANEWGIINGYPDGTFRGTNTITREEAMVMYAKAMDIAKVADNKSNKLAAYTDSAKVATWATPSAQRVVNAEIFNGKGNGILDPKGTLTEAEALTAVRNLLLKAELINK